MYRLFRTKQIGKALTHSSNKVSLCIFFSCEMIELFGVFWTELHCYLLGYCNIKKKVRGI